MSIHEWYLRRERGMPPQGDDKGNIMRSVYLGMQESNIRSTRRSTTNVDGCGPIFDIDFSTDGSFFGTACENKCFTLYDPRTTRITHTMPDAHEASVNCIKFLDNKHFVTASDDKLIRMWDARNMSSCVQTLIGHVGPVKGIQYARDKNMLISTGFDGVMLGWDMSQQAERNVLRRRLMFAPGMLRCCISANADRLVATSTGGYMILINNLNLNTLAEDFLEFQPQLLQLIMQRSDTIPATVPSVDLTRRNLVSLITDFPSNEPVDMFSALTMHPEGWCALSRCVTANNKEWTSVHDLTYATGRFRKSRREGNYRDDGDEGLFDETAFRASDPVIETMPFRRATRRAALTGAARIGPSEDASGPGGRASGNPNRTDRANNTNPYVCLCQDTGADSQQHLTTERRSFDGANGVRMVHMNVNTTLTIPPRGTNRCMCLNTPSATLGPSDVITVNLLVNAAEEGLNRAAGSTPPTPGPSGLRAPAGGDSPRPGPSGLGRSAVTQQSTSRPGPSGLGRSAVTQQSISRPGPSGLGRSAVVQQSISGVDEQRRNNDSVGRGRRRSRDQQDQSDRDNTGRGPSMRRAARMSISVGGSVSPPRAVRMNASQVPTPAPRLAAVRRAADDNAEAADQQFGDQEIRIEVQGRQPRRQPRPMNAAQPLSRHSARVDLLAVGPLQRAQYGGVQPFRDPSPEPPAPRPDLWFAQIPVRERHIGQGSPLEAYVSGVGVNNASWQRPRVWRNTTDWMSHRDPRLVFYSEEALHVSKYFLEPSFSPDGRIICSPCPNGVRLLMFDDKCSLPHSVAGPLPMRLIELKELGPGRNSVLCTKFSPREPFLVTGNFDGKIFFYQPML